MSKADPFGFDMSVSSAKKKNPRGKRGLTGGSETSTQVCQHEGCSEAGKFRAPKSPDVLDEFYWFCKEHVREYNLKWNFFTNQTEAEMNAQMSKDKVWERETKDFRDPEARALASGSLKSFVSRSHTLSLDIWAFISASVWFVKKFHFKLYSRTCSLQNQ